MAVDDSTDDLQDVLRPIVSLLSKSEKAQQKLAPGTWQHAMLRENLKALRIASALLKGETDATKRLTRDDFRDALRALASMKSRTEEAQAKFSLGTAQNKLLHNRLKALRTAETLTKAALDKTDA